MLKDHSRTQAKLKEDLGEQILSALRNDEIYEVMLNNDGLCLLMVLMVKKV